MDHTLAVVALGLLGAAAYGLDLWRRPLTRCWWCRENPGRAGGSTSKRWNYCRHCKDKPPRLRVGARLVRPDLRRK